MDRWTCSHLRDVVQTHLQLEKNWVEVQSMVDKMYSYIGKVSNIEIESEAVGSKMVNILENEIGKPSSKSDQDYLVKALNSSLFSWKQGRVSSHIGWQPALEIDNSTL